MAVKVTHILNDGRVLENIKGYKVPMNEDTMPFYTSIATYVKNKSKKTSKEETV